ncbi:hypothetical protein LXL04_001297 [Taraxacum kok-saghyz]
MASSSSSSMATAQRCFSHDVFLSFRGETRHQFTDHLHKALKRERIRIFRDDGIERGKILKDELEKAIHESEISLVVFSDDYASSKWCLHEVMMIIKEHETSSHKHDLVPVFYKVDTSDVKHQTGSFEKAFDKYEDEIKAETDLKKKTELAEKVRAWRDSLNKATNFTGYVYKNGYESEFIKKVVDTVISKIDYKLLYISDNLVGIDKDVAKIQSWLQDTSPDAVVLLIDGMGGIGKSTIARYIFNSNYKKFDGSSFLANINAASDKPDGLLRLQKQLILNVLKSEKEETIYDVEDGIMKVINTISNKKVLLILDDVTTEKQLRALLGRQRFHPGSKVIITTRHTDLKKHFTDAKVHSVRALSTVDATKLFSLHAFLQHQPVEGYSDLSNLVVARCKGLPLALEVLGSSLREKTTDEWEDTISRLEANPDPEIYEILEISYTSLKHNTDKELFLHIACFFEGEKKDYIEKILAQCHLSPVDGITNLMNSCLLYVDDGRVMMHQLIKEMGREVVYRESPMDLGKRSRLWDHQDCIDVLQDQSGTKKVQGLMIDMRKTEGAEPNSAITIYNPRKSSLEGKIKHGNYANFEIGALEKMTNLMLLQLNYVTFSGKCKKLPRKLRLLRWHGCTLKAIPSDVYLENLVVLDMSHSKLKHVWDDFKIHIRSLKILNLSYCRDLIKTPDFRRLPSLENLIVKGCSSLIKVDESIAYLKELILLDLTDCTSLREFPCLPTSLIKLEISGCRATRWAQSFNSTSLFSVLVEMTISYCNLSDTCFPNDWSGLVSLKALSIGGNNISVIPNCIQTLPILYALDVINCSKIQSILGLPESLTYLGSWCNDSLEKIQLPQTRSTIVHYNYCQNLYEIEGRWKVRPIEKVDRKIIRYMGLEPITVEGRESGLKCGTFVSCLLQKTIRCLGLESNADDGMELDLKVLHEFGIFSTLVSRKQIPSGFMYKERGPQISFQVPWHDERLRISGFCLCVVLSPSSRSEYFRLKIDVYNMTKDVLWEYYIASQSFPKNVESYALLNLWRCGNLLEVGNEVFIRITDLVYDDVSREVYERNRNQTGGVHQDVEECGINLIYEDDERQLSDGERNEAHHVKPFDQISWTDRMDEDISDYVCSGGRHEFYYGQNRYESEFIKKVVDIVISKIDYKLLYISDKLVGIDEDVAEIQPWLQDTSPDAVVLLIDGMGGIGKSTIAKCIFNLHFRNYDASCFLADINKETSNQTSGLCRLQSQLLSKILKSEKEETIWNVDEGTIKLRALLGRQRFHHGSKVIITTRHTDLKKHLTKAFTDAKVHSVRALSTIDATKLFSLHAFLQHQPVEGYSDLSNLVVACCKGLPLALKVLGSSLREKTTDEWEDTISRLEANPDPEIYEILEISYTSLKHNTDKELFLHIACFFEGEEIDYIVKILAQCHLSQMDGITNLMNSCVLYVDYFGRVMMHQLIKEMGREVVYRESPMDLGKRSRLWDHRDCIDVLQDQSGTKKVQGLMIDMRKTEGAEPNSAITIYNPRKRSLEGKIKHGIYANFEIGALEKMTNLMVLQLNYVTFSGKCKKLPRKLRLLRWHGYTLKRYQVYLLSSPFHFLTIVSYWNPKILNLSYCHDLIKTPEFSGLPGLENLILKGCSSLIKVDESIAYLEKLVLLDLTDCTRLTEFPCLPTFIVTLKISGCRAIRRVPSFNWTSLGSALNEMNISNCNLSDNCFPNDWSSLVLLEALRISGNNITFLPNCIQSLPILEYLDVQNCSNIQSILCMPESLSLIKTDKCESLENVRIPKKHQTEVTYDTCPKLYEFEGRWKARSIDKVDTKIIQYLGLESNAGDRMELDLKAPLSLYPKVLSHSLSNTLILRTKLNHKCCVCGTFVSCYVQKTKRCMDLESKMSDGRDLDLMVLHEFGIFSTCVFGKQIPSRFMYEGLRDRRISFEVPLYEKSLRISGFCLYVVFSSKITLTFHMSMPFKLIVSVHNIIKDLEWQYSRIKQRIPVNVENFTCSSLWRCGNLLEAGDEIFIYIEDASLKVRTKEECGINLIYEDDDQQLIDGERNEAHPVNAFDKISWTDRMDMDISDYVRSGGRNVFSCDPKEYNDLIRGTSTNPHFDLTHRQKPF